MREGEDRRGEERRGRERKEGRKRNRAANMTYRYTRAEMLCCVILCM
jgi:hypothetical protein